MKENQKITLIGCSGKIGSGKDTVAQIIQILTDYNVSDTVVVRLLKSSNTYTKSDWVVKKFAGKLKQIASILTNIPVEKFEDQEFKKTYLSPEWDTYGILREGGRRQIDVTAGHHAANSPWFEDGKNVEVHNQMTVRSFLQKLGTEAMRDGIHPNTWVNALFADYVPVRDFKVSEFLAAEGLPESMNGSVKEYPQWIISDVRFPNELEAVREHGGLTIQILRPVNALSQDNPAAALHPSEIALDDAEFDEKIINDGTLEDLVAKVRKLCEKHGLIEGAHYETDHVKGFY